jgi:NADH:ubiquinone reductase (H+-translocating)
MEVNIPQVEKKRVVIIGAGFAGLAIAQKLAKAGQYQIVLFDKNNYHQFQPLLYQVAMSGLEPSAIAFPLRKALSRSADLYLRLAEVLKIDPAAREVHTSLGSCGYDYLVLANGAVTNFFGNADIERFCIPMKSVSEALYLRNRILTDFEQAVSESDPVAQKALMNIIVVGGGATGVEVAGALAEMKRYVLPKDYPELRIGEIEVLLLEGGDRLLSGMSAAASRKALEFLQKMGVKVKLGTMVTQFDGERLLLNDGTQIHCRKVIWAAGITGSPLEGLPPEAMARGKRLRVNRFSQVQGFENIFAIGDGAFMEEEKYPQGHPQLAQAAIQQGRHLALNLERMHRGLDLLPFSYKDLGAMATIGRNRAVVDLPRFRFQGLLAWFVWLFVHLFQILGVKNRVSVFFNWVWNYVTYDQPLRLIIRPKDSR